MGEAMLKAPTAVGLTIFVLAGCTVPPPSAPPAAAPAPPPTAEFLYAVPPPSPPEGTSVAVFYATDRQKTTTPGSYETYYGAGLNTPYLQYGEAIVTIPPRHTRGELERPFELFGIQFRKENGKKDIVIYKMKDVDRSTFLSDLRQAVAKEGKEVFIFIHGFNTTFAEGLRQTAQLKTDLPFYGPALMYSWPSDGRVPAFTADVNLSLTTVQHLEQFLQEMAATPSITGIHILAHSLGSRPLLFALYDLRKNALVSNKIKNVILAAPEIPQVTYSQIASTFKTPNPYKITLYVSDRDEVLTAAEDLDQVLSGEYIPRLGDMRKGIFIEGMCTCVR